VQGVESLAVRLGVESRPAVHPPGFVNGRRHDQQSDRTQNDTEKIES
jgi:hypothetical protein